MTTTPATTPPCAKGHTWTSYHPGDPLRGTPCDCGKKLWGIPVYEHREHEWEWYFNGTFCKRCGCSIGSVQPCR